jgi:hypothetical protein
MSKQKASGFRHNTGPTEAPWSPTVASVRCEDIMDAVSSSVPRGKAQAAKVEHELKKLCAMGSYAAKLAQKKQP